MRPERFLAEQGGMALLLTLMIISFLAAITIQLTATVDRQAFMAAAQREQARLDASVLGGLSLARAALLVDQKENKADSPLDQWATGFDEEKLATLDENVSLKVKVTDLAGLLQINALGSSATTKNPGGSGQGNATDRKEYRKIWRRLLLSGRFAVEGESEADQILDALADWVDKDNNERDDGAEEAYYQGLTPSYRPRNDEMQYLEEVLLVKGMTHALFYGDGEHEGLRKYMTVQGTDGKININTAPMAILEALSVDMTEDVAQELIEFRENSENAEALENVTWYKEVGGFVGDAGLDSSVLSVSSNYFKIVSTATESQFKRVGSGILYRNKNQEQTLLLWKQE